MSFLKLGITRLYEILFTFGNTQYIILHILIFNRLHLKWEISKGQKEK
jgi:hypothetical protein